MCDQSSLPSTRLDSLDVHCANQGPQSRKAIQRRPTKCQVRHNPEVCRGPSHGIVVFNREILNLQIGDRWDPLQQSPVGSGRVLEKSLHILRMPQRVPSAITPCSEGGSSGSPHCVRVGATWTSATRRESQEALCQQQSFTARKGFVLPSSSKGPLAPPLTIACVTPSSSFINKEMGKCRLSDKRDDGTSNNPWSRCCPLTTEWHLRRTWVWWSAQTGTGTWLAQWLVSVAEQGFVRPIV